MAKSLKADENEPSTTHNCESSRAPKKSTTLLKQHLNSERRTVKNKGFGEILSRFQVKPQLGSNRKFYCAHFSIQRGSQTQPGEQDRDDLRIRVPLHVEKRAIQPTHPELSQNMYPLSSQALRRRAPCSRPATASHKYIDNCQCTAPHEQRSCRCTTTDPPRTCTRTGTAPTRRR